jgi:hypothetical protein
MTRPKSPEIHTKSPILQSKEYASVLCPAYVNSLHAITADTLHPVQWLSVIVVNPTHNQADSHSR